MDLLRFAFNLDRNEGNNRNILKDMPYHCFGFFYENSFPLHLDKLIFHYSERYVILRHE